MAGYVWDSLAVVIYLGPKLCHWLDSSAMWLLPGLQYLKWLLHSRSKLEWVEQLRGGWQLTLHLFSLGFLTSWRSQRT